MFERLKSLPWLAILIGSMTVLRLVAAANMNLVPDEAYYWLWSRHPAAGYYDHPPMVAWWIMIAPDGFDTSLFVRLLFVLSFLGVTWFMYDAARVLFDEAVARRTALWLNACLLLSVGSVLATPDPPSVLMWAGGLWALARLQASDQGQYWLVFGLFAGLGVEAKYTNLFLGLGVVAWMILDTPARKWLLTPWPYLGAVVALAAMAPNLLWNLQHDWISVTKQFGRIGASHLTLNFLIEFLLSQPLLLNPLVFAFTVLGALAAFQTKDSRLRLLVATPMPLFAYLLVHVFHDRIQGNWTAPVFPGLVLLGAVVAEGLQGPSKLQRVRWLAAPVGIGLSVVVLVLMSVSGHVVGMGGLSESWFRLADGIFVKSHRTDWIAVTDYNTQGELAYETTRPTLSWGFAPYAMAERERYPWQGLPPKGRALIVVAADKTIDVGRCFTHIEDAGTVSRTVKPGKKSTYRLYTGTLSDPHCDLAR